MSAYPISDPEPIARPTTIFETARGHLVAVPDLTGYAELRIWAESYADAQDHRIRLFNRVGLKADGTPTKSGTAVDLDSFAHIVEPVLTSEKHIKRMLLKTYRRVAPPGVVAWQQSTVGIGDHGLARLLGVLGHPRIATPYHWEGEGAERKLVADEVFERTVRQLWTYCGHGAALRRRKGMTVEEAFGLGSPRLKSLVHVLALAAMRSQTKPTTPTDAECVSAGLTPPPEQPMPTPGAMLIPAARELSPHPPTEVATARTGTAGGDLSADQPIYGPKARVCSADRRYRLLYEQRRAHTATTHPDWTAGHSHNDALRIVGKQLLADLWEAAA